jgi:branched-chain amino acid transport system substrate-binding protein
VLGGVRHPFPGNDFSLLPAAGAIVQGQGHRAGQCRRRHHQLDQAGVGVRHHQGGQNLAGMLMFINDVHSLGLNTAQGLIFTESFYWDLNDNTRAWSKRFAAGHNGKMPSMVQAGVYGARCCTT